MSDFEFLSVLVSIVVGLGLTHLLRGLGHAYYFRRGGSMDAVHIAWTIATLFVLVLNWWVFLLWRDFGSWTFSTFFVVILWTSSFYMMALALYPPGLSEETDYRELFAENRTWFLATFTVMAVLDLLVTTLRDDRIPELYYLAFVGHYGLITAIGIVVRRRWYDLAAAWYIAIGMAFWSFGVRETLF
jgi:hypothetical protein